MADEKKKSAPKTPIFDFSDSTKRTKWFLRAVSILFAVILWFFVSWDGTTYMTKDLSVPLRYLDVPDGYSLSERVGNVTIRIGGSLETLALLGRNDVNASISLQDLRPGRYRLPIQISNPQSLKILKVTPQSVEFDLYRMIERTLRPTLEIEGELPDGLMIENAAFEPGEVVVKGPEGGVVAIRRAVAKATAENLRGVARRELPVVLYGDDGEISDLAVEPPTVWVSATFSDVMEEARVPVVIRVKGVPGGGLDIDRVTVSPDMVTLRGTKSALSGVSELTLDAMDVTGHTENINIDIPIESPAQGITISGTDSVRVSVEFHSSRETRTFLGVPITIGENPPGSAWKAAPPTASVILERSMTETGPFDIENPPIELYVDVTNVVTEQLSLPVLYRGLPSGMRVVRIEPSQVYVTASN